MLHYFGHEFLEEHIINNCSNESKKWNEWMAKTIPNYLTIQLLKPWKNDDFEELLKFIGGHCCIKNSKLNIDKESQWENNEAKLFSNAYKAIQYEVRYYCPGWVCSNEIKALRFSKKILCQDFIRIPYKVQYLFATIYDIVQEILRKGGTIPKALEKSDNALYSHFYDVMCFYQFARVHTNNWDTLAQAHANLNMGLEKKLEDVPFNKSFQKTQCVEIRENDK